MAFLSPRKSLNRLFNSKQQQPAVDLDAPLTPEEHTELCIHRFIDYAVYGEGKFGQAKVEWYAPDEDVRKGAFFEVMLDNFIQIGELKLYINQLNEFLDEYSYRYILKDYMQKFNAEEEDKKRNLVAVIAAISFSRLYAQEIRAQPNRLNSGRDLLAIKKYTTRVVTELIQDGMRLTWDEFLDETRQYRFAAPNHYMKITAVQVAISVIGCAIAHPSKFVRKEFHPHGHVDIFSNAISFEEKMKAVKIAEGVRQLQCAGQRIWEETRQAKPQNEAPPPETPTLFRRAPENCYDPETSDIKYEGSDDIKTWYPPDFVEKYILSDARFNPNIKADESEYIVDGEDYDEYETDDVPSVHCPPRLVEIGSERGYRDDGEPWKKHYVAPQNALSSSLDELSIQQSPKKSDWWEREGRYQERKPPQNPRRNKYMLQRWNRSRTPSPNLN